LKVLSEEALTGRRWQLQVGAPWPVFTCDGKELLWARAILRASRAAGLWGQTPFLHESKVIISPMEIPAELKAALTEGRLLGRGVCARPQRGGRSR